MGKYFFVYGMILSAYATLSAMIADNSTTNAINHLLIQDIIKTAQHKTKTYHVIQENYYSYKHQTGHYSLIPERLKRSNGPIFSGMKEWKKQNKRYNIIQSCPDDFYQAEVTQTTQGWDTVIVYPKNDIREKLKNQITLFNDRPFTTALCFSPSSTHLVTGSINSISIWDLETKEELLLSQDFGSPFLIEFNHSGSKMITMSFTGNQGTLCLWDTADINNPTSIKKTIITTSLCYSGLFSPADDRIVICCENGEILFVDGNTGNVIKKTHLQSHGSKNNIISYPIFTPDNLLCITATSRSDSNKTCIILWDCTSGKKLKILATISDKAIGIGLVPDNRSIMVLSPRHIEVIDLFSQTTAYYLHYLKTEASIIERKALQVLYALYQMDGLVCSVPLDIELCLPENVFLRHFIKKHLCKNNPANTVIQLKDKSRYTFTSAEIASCNALSRKQAMLNQITPDLISKWGYPTTLYEKFKTAPMLIDNISSTAMSLVKKFLAIPLSEQLTSFNQLTNADQNCLMFAASDNELSIPHLYAQLCQICAIKQIAEKHAYPHISIKNVISYLRYSIIKHNMTNQKCIITQELIPEKKCFLTYNRQSKSLTFVPNVLRHKNYYSFSGFSKDIVYPQNNQTWKTHRHIISEKNPEVMYYITAYHSFEKAKETGLKAFGDEEMILWCAQKNFISKMILEDKDRKSKINIIEFSPNGAYLALGFYSKNDPQYFYLKTLGTQSDFSDYSDTFFCDITNELEMVSFDPSSEHIALASAFIPDINEDNISIRNIQTGEKIASFSTAEFYKVHDLQFSSDGTRLLCLSHSRDLSSHILLYDVVGKKCIQEINLSGKLTASSYFSKNDSLIVVTLLSTEILFLNGNTGEIIYGSMHPRNVNPAFFASTLNKDNTLFVTAHIDRTYHQSSDAALWDTETNKRIATFPKKGKIVGVGFTPDKRHVVMVECESSPDKVKDSYYLSTIPLFDKATEEALLWLKNQTSLSQRYLLQTAFSLKQKGLLDNEYKSLVVNECGSGKSDNPMNTIIENIIKEHL